MRAYKQPGTLLPYPSVTGRALAKSGIVRKIHNYFVDRYSHDVFLAGTAASPRLQAARSIANSMRAVPLAAVLSAVLFTVTEGLPFAFLFMAAPPITFFMGRFGLREAIRRRAAGAESEIFFFAIYCDIMEKTGRGLHGAFEALVEDARGGHNTGRGERGAGGQPPSTWEGRRQPLLLFPFMLREALLMRREIRVFSKSFSDILHRLGHGHPSPTFRDFLRGYTVSQSAGGTGAAQYLHERIREYQVAARQRMESFASTSEMLAAVGSFGLVMLPIFIVVGGIMIDKNTLLYVCAFGILSIPATIAVLIKVSGAMSPVPPVSIRVRHIPVLAAACCGAAAACMLLLVPADTSPVAEAATAAAQLQQQQQQPDQRQAAFRHHMKWWEAAAFPLITWCFANFAASRRQLGGIAGLERSVPSFIRDINQKMRSSPSFFGAFTSIERGAPYAEPFNDVLRRIKSRVSLGVEISLAMQTARTGSWLADSVLRLLAHAARTGSVTPAVLDRLATFASHHLETRREMAAKTTTPLMTGYMGSIIAVMMILMIPVMSFDQFAALDDMMSTVDFQRHDFDISGTLAELNLVLVVVGAFCSMALVSQIRYRTMLHSLHTGVLLSAITGMLYYDRYVGGPVPGV